MKNGAVSTIPAAEWRLDSDLVRLLVVEQCPSWAGLAVEPFANGWDNAMFTLGDKHLVRLPRRAAAVPLLAGEIRWLPELAGRLPVPVPRPVFVGRPSPTFPHPWSVVDRLSGTPAASIPASARTPAADDLADFLLDLHHRAPVDAPANPVRGIALDSPSLAHRARARLAAQPSDGQHSDAQPCRAEPADDRRRGRRLAHARRARDADDPCRARGRGEFAHHVGHVVRAALDERDQPGDVARASGAGAVDQREDRAHGWPGRLGAGDPDEQGIALPAAAAQGRGTDASAATLQLEGQVENDAGTRHADGMAQRDGTAVDIDDVIGDLERAHGHDADCGEGLVELEQVDVGDAVSYTHLTLPTSDLV